MPRPRDYLGRGLNRSAVPGATFRGVPVLEPLRRVAPPPAAALLGLDRLDDEPERRNPKPGPPWRINTACQDADQCRGDRGADELRALVAGMYAPAVVRRGATTTAAGTPGPQPGMNLARTGSPTGWALELRAEDGRGARHGTHLSLGARPREVLHPAVGGDGDPVR